MLSWTKSALEDCLQCLKSLLSPSLYWITDNTYIVFSDEMKLKNGCCNDNIVVRERFTANGLTIDLLMDDNLLDNHSAEVLEIIWNTLSMYAFTKFHGQVPHGEEREILRMKYLCMRSTACSACADLS